MSEYFKKNTKIPLTDKGTAVIQERLGEGGQGVVYRVTVGKQDYALKWYHNGAIANPKRFYKNLGDNIAKGAPTAAFLWPLVIARTKSIDFGNCTATVQ